MFLLEIIIPLKEKNKKERTKMVASTMAVAVVAATLRSASSIKGELRFKEGTVTFSMMSSYLTDFQNNNSLLTPLGKPFYSIWADASIRICRHFPDTPAPSH